MGKFCLDNSVDIHSTATPTHIPACPRFRPDESKNCIYNINTYTLNILNSPHNPVFFQIDSPIPHKIKTFRRTNWEEFREILESTNNPEELNSKEVLDESVNKLTESIQTALHRSTRVYPDIENKYGLSKEILQKIRHKNFIRTQWQRYRRRSDKITLNRLNKEIKQEVQYYVNHRFSEFVENATTENGNVWKAWNLCKPGGCRKINKIQGVNGLVYTED